MRLAAWSMDGKWITTWKGREIKWSWPNWRHYSGIFLEGLSEITRNSGCPVCKPANRWRRRRKVCLIQDEAAESSVRRWNSFNNNFYLLLSLLTSYKKEARPPNTTGSEHTITVIEGSRPYTDQTFKLTSSADTSLLKHEIRIVMSQSDTNKLLLVLADHKIDYI